MPASARLLVYFSLLTLAGLLVYPYIQSRLPDPPGFTEPWHWLVPAMLSLLVLSYVFISAWLLIVLGTLSLMALLISAVLYPFLLPLLSPCLALWLWCATARRQPRAVPAKPAAA